MFKQEHNRTMKKILSILSFVLIYQSPTFASGGPFGLGVIINSPTGFSGKYRLSEKNSIDAALGYSFGRSDNITLHSTYLWEKNQGIPIDNTFLGYYFGIGGALHMRDENEAPPPWAESNRTETLGLAIRGVGGINYYLKDPVIEFFAELSMAFFFVPSTDIDLGLAIGGRYFF